MFVEPSPSARPVQRRPGQRFPALLWSLLHAPVILACYAPAVSAAVAAVPARYRLALWPTFVPQALLLGLAPWLVTLPLSGWRRGYRWALPALSALFTAVLALDSQVYRAVGFHLNGFFFKVMLEPHALAELGLPLPIVAAVIAGALVAIGALTLAGAWFIGRLTPSPRAAWPIALGLLLLSGVERVYGETLAHQGGPAVFAASGVLPLQAPIRFEEVAVLLFGKEKKDPFAGVDAQRLRPALDPRDVRFTRKPDVLFLVTESLPFDHLDAQTMPNLWRRAEEGARFTRHYSTASATHYAIFSLFYGLGAQKLEATVGAGRQPAVFPSFAQNGYTVDALAASCVDWMQLKETVFGGVTSPVETWCKGNGTEVDQQMVTRAREIVRDAPRDKPLFMFLFFDGTHFPYPYDPRDRAFTPEWDGAESIKVTSEAGWKIKNRARNAARTVDRVVEEFLEDFQRTRGSAPIVFFTGDHGEEFRQKGHVAHGSDVTDEQIHVPAIFFGPGVPRGVFDAPTSHTDVTPTLLALLGDTHPASLYSDGMDMFRSPLDRFVVATVGWEPRYAVVGKDLKVRMFAGLGSTDVTDPDDRPLADGDARFAASAARIMKAMRGEAEPLPAPTPTPAVTTPAVTPASATVK
jgi:membrane-anchored protein YejM (alkaline phosphatase superfamily)